MPEAGEAGEAGEEGEVKCDRHGKEGRGRAGGNRVRRGISASCRRSPMGDIDTWINDSPVPCGEERVSNDKETQCQLDLSVSDRARSVTSSGSSGRGERGA
jgi:hypothetical protein